jgi:hypothetical protein
MKDDSPGRRAAAYWFADGLPDIVFGLMLLVFATAGFLWQIYAPHSLALDLFLMAGGFGLFYWQERAVLGFLKSRVTYPRTGYAQPPDEAPISSGLTTLSLNPGPPAPENVTYFNKRTAPVIFSLFYCAFNPQPPGRWLAPLIVLALAVALYTLNRNSERPYRWWWALILALAGLVFFLVDVPPLLQPLLLYMLAGGWLVAQGVCTLVGYLRANPEGIPA